MKKKLFIYTASLVLIYVFNFFIPRLMPGDPLSYTSSVSGEDVTTDMSEEQKALMRAYYGLDLPLHKQFGRAIQSNVALDFGMSIHYKRPVADIIKERLPWSLAIVMTCLILSSVIGTCLALLCVRYTKVDRYIFGVQSLIAEIPPFLIGILLLFFVATNVTWIPLAGGATPFVQYASWLDGLRDRLRHALLPITAMTLVTIPPFFFTARASFLDIVLKPYIVTAKSKGLSERRIRWVYVFKNGVTPIIVRFFLSVGSAIGGTLLIENVFAYPGLGIVMRESVRYRDYLMIQGVFLVSTVTVLVSLLIADVLNTWIDKGRRLT